MGLKVNEKARTRRRIVFLIHDHADVSLIFGIIKPNLCPPYNVSASVFYLTWKALRAVAIGLFMLLDTYEGIRLHRVGLVVIYFLKSTITDSCFCISFSLRAATGIHVNLERSTVVIYSSGLCAFIPTVNLQSSCTMDLTYFPFDRQKCDIKFGSWTYNGEKVGIDWRMEPLH